ncbi:MAG: uroporphyrinogen-III synthase [Candidatus Thiodiazotropha sp. (ex Epidulcina cf. delphinae)]|nr:uroporphyrinogen-III synthase [Candidatus Thiodiazotropha sp. (ex Epidulcina cf. delphinae)]
MADCDLKGRGILITRAAHQAGGLSRLIHACHGTAVLFPTLEISACDSPEPACGLLRHSWDVMIFVSPNAVCYALRLLPAERLQTVLLGAVGQATAAALRESGYGIDLVPAERYDSEGLLMLAPLQRLDGQKVLIVRGEGGRPLLGDTLQARGAEVGYAEVYRRTRPQTDPAPLLSNWARRIDLVTVTSTEVLRNLIAMLGEQGWPLLRQTPLLVISERMRMEAERQGFESVLPATGADDKSVMTAIRDWVDESAETVQGR